MWKIEYVLGAILLYIGLRFLLIKYMQRLVKKRALYQEYNTVLHNPQYRVRGQFEE